DAVAGPPAAHVGANLADYAGDLQAEDVAGAGRWSVAAARLRQIGAVHAGGPHLHEHFVRPNGHVRHVFPDERRGFIARAAMHDDSFHSRLPSLHFVRQGDCTCPPDREHPCSQVFRPGMAAIRIGEPCTGRAKRYTTMRAQARNQGSKEYLTMSKRDVYTVQVAGLTRHLPLFEVAPGVRIAIFNMLGDT